MKEKKHNSITQILNKQLFVLVAMVVLLSTPQISKAQFTYIGATTGFRNSATGASDGFGSFDTRPLNYGLFLNVKAIHRPLRFLGVGAEFTFPMVQGNTNNSYDFARFATTEIQYSDYSAEQAFSFTGIASLFADTEANFHVDFRFSYFSFKEEFRYVSNGFYGTNSEKANFPAAGFALGFMPHLSKHLFFDINFGLDFLLMGSDPDFSYNAYLDNSFKYVRIESQLSGVKPSLFMNIGLGYYF